MIARLVPGRVATAGLLATSLALTVAAPASAHASLVHAHGRPGQVFRHNIYPRVLAAFFAENVNPKGSFPHVFEGDPRSDHALVDPDNDAFPFKDQKEITVGRPRRLTGLYPVMWLTVSADDGYKAGSAYTFTVR